MQSRILITAIIAAALNAPAVAYADSPGYKYVEAGYVYADPEVLDTSTDGIELAGSMALTDRIHLDASHIEVNDGSARYELSTLSLGWNHPLTDTTDVVTRAGYLREDANVVIGESQSGYIVQFGSRSMITPRFEMNGFLNYINAGDTGMGGGGFGVRFALGESFSVGANFDFYKDLTLLRGGLRYNF